MVAVANDPRWPMRVIRWTNGMVMVFDQRGEQIPGLQGTVEDVRASVLAAARPDTTFEGGDWNSGASWPLDAGRL